MNSIILWHRITQFSFLGLLITLCVWALLFPPTALPPVAVLIAWILPLLFAAPGIFQKKLYTYAWAQFVNMIYFCHSVMYLMSSPEEQFIAAIELVLVLSFFTGAVVTIQLTKRDAESSQA